MSIQINGSKLINDFKDKFGIEGRGRTYKIPFEELDTFFKKYFCVGEVHMKNDLVDELWDKYSEDLYDDKGRPTGKTLITEERFSMFLAEFKSTTASREEELGNELYKCNRHNHDLEKRIEDVASHAWKAAANAHKVYPNSKHTFSDYWSNSGKEYAVSNRQKNIVVHDDKGFNHNLLMLSLNELESELEINMKQWDEDAKIRAARAVEDLKLIIV